MNKITRFDPSKEALEFLSERIKSDNYRGFHVSQHNRYDLKEISTILKKIYEFVEMEKMQIRTTDLSKRPYNLPGEEIYANFVNEVNKNVKKGTQDSIRKNLFVDLHRMGLINRYKEIQKGIFELGPYESSTNIKYITLTQLGKKLIDTEKFIDKRKIYSRAIDNLTNLLVSNLIDVFNELNYYITINEYQYFFSFFNNSFDEKGFIYTPDLLKQYILEYRTLPRVSKKALTDNIKEICNPKNFKGNKITKRDYHNWKNEAQQVFNLLNQTAFFEANDSKLILRTGESEFFENNSDLKRSESEKKKYFKNHSINKIKGFELHHIIPLSWANDINEFNIIDSWKNLIYIDGYKHSVISQNSNKHVKLEFENKDVLFKDMSLIKDSIECKYGDNVKYDVNKKEILIEYNNDLLNSLV